MSGFTFRRSVVAMLVVSGVVVVGVVLAAALRSGVPQFVALFLTLLVSGGWLIQSAVSRERHLAGAAAPGTVFRGSCAVELDFSLPPDLWSLAFSQAKLGRIRLLTEDHSVQGIVEFKGQELSWTPERVAVRWGVRAFSVPWSSVRKVLVSEHGKLRFVRDDGSSVEMIVLRLRKAVNELASLGLVAEE
jgi:hypothetical protein